MTDTHNGKCFLPDTEQYQNGRLGIQFIQWLELDNTYHSDTFELLLLCELAKALINGPNYNIAPFPVRRMVFQNTMPESLKPIMTIGLNNGCISPAFTEWLLLVSSKVVRLSPDDNSQLIPETIDAFLKTHFL